MLFIFSLFIAFQSHAINLRIQVLPAKLKQLEIRGLGLMVQAEDQFHRDLGTNLIIQVDGTNWKLIRKNQIKVLTSEVLRIQGEALYLNDQAVPNQLEFSSKFQNRIQVIAEMEIEDYLKGVVPAEMPASWPLESLKAQAVAARSYAMATVRERSNREYHLDSSIHFQVFNWMKFMGAKVIYRDKVTQAVEGTRGQYLIQDGRPYKTYYHSHCGGRTEEATSVWGVGAKNGIIPDESCALDVRSLWNYQISAMNLGKSLKLGPIKTVTVVNKTSSQRNNEIRLASNSEIITLTGQSLRQKLGFSNLKSTYFHIHKDGDIYTFTGRGYGHGVGLCQTGSRFMAMAGADYKEILEKYFPRAYIGSKSRTVVRNNRSRSIKEL